MKRDFAAVSTPELAQQITKLAGQLNAANARFLTLIAELDRRQPWAEWGVKSCAHWLNWQCAIDLGAAREKLRVAHAMEKLPCIAKAMTEGKLSYSKVRALTRVADETNEGQLLDIALHGTASHVEKLVQSYRRAKGAQEVTREAIQQRDQSLTYFTDTDGSLVIRAACRPKSVPCSGRHSRWPKIPYLLKTFPRKRLWMNCTRVASAGSRPWP